MRAVFWSSYSDLAATLDELRGSTETLTLAISPTAADALLSAALLRVQREVNTPVEVIVANSRTVKQMVAAGQVDVGVAAFTLDEHARPRRRLPFRGRDRDRRAARHPWARARHVTARSSPPRRSSAATREHRRARSSMRRCALAGYSPPIAAVEVGTTEAAKLQAHERGLPAVMSRLAVTASDRLEIVRVDGVEFRRRTSRDIAGCPAPGRRPPPVCVTSRRRDFSGDGQVLNRAVAAVAVSGPSDSGKGLMDARR